MAKWKIEYYDGANWVTLSGKLKRIMQELDGHEEARFIIGNTAGNRTVVSQNRDVKISFDGTAIFKGTLYGVVYSRDLLECIAYNKCYETMKTKDYTHTYTATAASTILSDVCTAAGVVAGVCPSTNLSVRFKRAICFDIGVFLADACNSEFYADEDAGGNPRFNIATRGSAKGAITPVSWPNRGIDRSKKRDKVIVRGVDADGNEIEGSAGTGADVAVYLEKKASDVETLNNLASKKLAQLNKESSGVKLPVKITDAYNLYPGDTITLSNSDLNLSGDFRIWRITKHVDVAEVEVDRAEKILEDYLAETKQYGDLGIYEIVGNAQIVDGAVTNPKIADSAVDTSKIADNAVDTTKIADLAVNNAKITDAAITTAKIGDAQITDAKIEKYVLGKSGITFPSSPTDGEVFYRTDLNKCYRYDAANLAWVAVDFLESSDRVADGVITSAKIADLAVSSAKIADLAVGTAKIADLAVDTAKIVDAAIETAKIADAAITNAKIANLAVDTAKIADASVSNLKIMDNTITFIKTANNFGKDSYFKDFRTIVTGESLSGYDYYSAGSGSGVAGKNKIICKTGTTAYSYFYLEGYQSIKTDYSPSFKARIKITSSDAQTTGRVVIGDGWPYFGFTFAGTATANQLTLRGYSSDAVGNYTVIDLLTISADTFYILECKYTFNSKVEFWVNGVLEGTITTNLPPSSTREELYAGIQNGSSAVDRQLEIWYYTAQEDWWT